MHSNDIKQDSLQSLIDDLNYATLMEDRWRIEFVDAEGIHRVMGNGYKRIKDGIWVTHLDRDKGEFPRIRIELESANTILSVSLHGMIQKFVSIIK